MHDSGSLKLDWFFLPTLAISLALFLCSIIINISIIPLWQETFKKSQKIETLKALTTNKKGFTLLSKGYQKRLKELELKHDSLTQGTEGVTEAASVITIVYDAALKNTNKSIKFNATRPQPEIRRQNRIEVPIIFELTTTYSALGILLTRLERYPHLLQIEGLSIEPISATRLDVTLVVTGLLLPEGELPL